MAHITYSTCTYLPRDTTPKQHVCACGRHIQELQHEPSAYEPVRLQPDVPNLEVRVEIELTRVESLRILASLGLPRPAAALEVRERGSKSTDMLAAVAAFRIAKVPPCHTKHKGVYHTCYHKVADWRKQSSQRSFFVRSVLDALQRFVNKVYWYHPNGPFLARCTYDHDHKQPDYLCLCLCLLGIRPVLDFT